MAKKRKKRSLSTYERRRMRRQRIIFGIIAAILIISWIVSLVANV